VELDKLTCDGQADTESGLGVILSLQERLENAWQQIRGDATTCVGHRQHRFSRTTREVDQQSTAGIRVPNPVREEI
jgi:hypothetical protein